MNKVHSNSYSSACITYTSHWKFKDTCHFWSYIYECKDDRDEGCLDCKFVNVLCFQSIKQPPVTIDYYIFKMTEFEMTPPSIEKNSKLEIIFLNQVLNFLTLFKGSRMGVSSELSHL